MMIAKHPDRLGQVAEFVPPAGMRDDEIGFARGQPPHDADVVAERADDGADHHGADDDGQSQQCQNSGEGHMEF